VSVLAEVRAERARQDATWGQQDHPDATRGAFYGDYGIISESDARERCDVAAKDGMCTFAHILIEEVAEAIDAALIDGGTHDQDLRKELVQVAAVAVSWIEAIDRRTT
jgi:hypothetical protein